MSVDLTAAIKAAAHALYLHVWDGEGTPSDEARCCGFRAVEAAFPFVRDAIADAIDSNCLWVLDDHSECMYDAHRQAALVRCLQVAE